MTKLFRTQRRIEWSDTDAARIAHFTAFFRFMEEVEHEYLRALGLSVLMHDETGAISWPRVSVACEFSNTVKFEEVVDIDVQIKRLGDRSVTYSFDFSRPSIPIAAGHITAVCCRFNEQGVPRSCRIPDWIREKLQSTPTQ